MGIYMNNHLKWRGWVGSYFHAPFQLGFILIMIDILVFILNWPSGLVLLAFLVIYFAVIGFLYMNNRMKLMNEFLRLAGEYGRTQKNLLRKLEIPMAFLDDTGRVMWTNEEFERITQRTSTGHPAIGSIFPDIKKEILPRNGEAIDIPVRFEDNSYKVHMKDMPMEELARKSGMFKFEETFEYSITAVYLVDTTATELALREVDNQSMCAMLIYIDNYEEALDSLEDVRRSLLIALIDRKVNRYVLASSGICSKVEKDKYLAILPKKSIRQMQEERFTLLDDVKTVNIGNEMAITLSIGVGLDGLTYAQNYEFARNAIDLALGRGGDQAVLKKSEEIVYYGGKSQQVEKSTRVKARVKAHALREILMTRDVVYIMGHRLGDPDSFGACVGIYRIARHLNRKAFIVLNERTTSIRQILEQFEKSSDFDPEMLLTGKQALDSVAANSALVVVDTNKPEMTECPELLHLCKSVVVFDHHRQGKDVIEGATLSYIEPYASSACEMVTEMMRYVDESVKLRPEEADALYGGIVVDTNNFMNHTGVRTFEAAAFLRRWGADVTRVRKTFREDPAEYRAKADAVSRAEVYRDYYAISECNAAGLTSPTVVGAQAANELLDIKNVKASFILTLYQEKVFVSARSIDEINVQLIMEKMGGGGHLDIAGCQLAGRTVAQAREELKRVIDSMIDNGEI